MGFLMAAASLMAVLFVLMFFSRRRYGVMALALAAGAMISTLWVGDLTPLVARAGVVMVQPPLDSVVAAGLVLILPAFLLFSGPVYHNKGGRTLGSLLFALLAVLLLLDIMQSAIVIDGVSKTVFDAMQQYKPVGVTALFLLAVVDVWTTRTPKPVLHEPKH